MSDVEERPLPDRQPLAESLEALAEGDWLDRLGQLDEHLSTIKSAEDALLLLKERAGELAEAVEAFNTGREAATGTLQALENDLSAESAHWQSSVNEAGEDVQDACRTLDRLRTDATQRAGERLDQLRQVAVEQLHEAHLVRIEDSRTAVADITRSAAAKADGLGGDLVSQAQDGLRQLGRSLTDDLGSRIEREAAQRFTAEAGRLGGEVANNLVLSQASVAITGAVTPILPQLIALKAAVSVIKLALHPFG